LSDYGNITNIGDDYKMTEFYQIKIGIGIQYYSRDFLELVRELLKLNEAIGKNKIQNIAEKLENYKHTLARLLREYS